jgi:hypothetical protein
MLGYIAAEFVINTCQRKKGSFIGLGISSGMCFGLALMIIF